MINALKDAQVELYHNNNLRVTTTDDGTDFGGTGSIRVPNGTTGQRNASPQACLLYTSPSPRDLSTSRMPSSA